MVRILVLIGLVLGGLQPVRAQDASSLVTGTLAAINARGTIRIGVRDGAIPFAFRNPGGQPVGFSVDLCLGIAADVAAALNRDLLEPGAPAWNRGIRIEYVPVAADARIPMLLSGAIDLECGSTTANAERARQIAFSPIFFLAGTKLLVKTGSGIASYRDLVGKTVAVGVGTTNQAVMDRLAARAAPAFTVRAYPTLDAAFAAIALGEAAAMASDDILLAGLIAGKGGGTTWRVVGDYLSYEPYAIGLRRDDPDFAALVQQSFRRMAEAGILRTSYDRWFLGKLPNGERLDLPISAHLSEMYRALGQPD